MVKCEVAKRTLKLSSWVPSLLQVCSSLKARRFNCGIRVQCLTAVQSSRVRLENCRGSWFRRKDVLVGSEEKP
jgi:hypothetical protein